MYFKFRKSLFGNASVQRCTQWKIKVWCKRGRNSPPPPFSFSLSLAPSLSLSFSHFPLTPSLSLSLSPLSPSLSFPLSLHFSLLLSLPSLSLSLPLSLPFSLSFPPVLLLSLSFSHPPLPPSLMHAKVQAKFSTTLVSGFSPSFIFSEKVRQP